MIGKTILIAPSSRSARPLWVVGDGASRYVEVEAPGWMSCFSCWVGLGTVDGIPVRAMYTNPDFPPTQYEVRMTMLTAAERAALQRGVDVQR